MASSNPENIPHKKSDVSHTDSKSKSPSVSEKNHLTHPKKEDVVPDGDGHTKPSKSKVEDALRFVASLFEEGGPAQMNEGFGYMFSSLYV